jgi:putative membrane protein
MNFLLRIIISAIAVFLVSMFLPGVKVDDYLTALLVAVVLAFLNAIVRPILILLTIPVTIFSLGLFLLVINAFLVVLAGKLVDGFHVEGFLSALLFSIILSLTTGLLNLIFGVSKED